jgi:hypothetical protein
VYEKCVGKQLIYSTFVHIPTINKVIQVNGQ